MALRHALALALALTGCTDDSGSGPGVTTHVITLEFPASMGGACLDVDLADVDVTTPGPQYECSVTQIVTAPQVETVLPQCNNVASPQSSTNQPCWAVVQDSTCAAASHQKLAIVRTDAPPDATVKAQCLAPS